MDISIFLQNSLKIVWVIFGLTALILILGLILSRQIARRVVDLLNYASAVNFIARRWKTVGVELINRRIQQITRALVFAFFAWGAWGILNSHPDISNFVIDAQQALIDFARLPIIIFLLNLALIGLETFALLKAFSWIRGGFEKIADKIKTEQGKRLKGFKIQQWNVFTASQLTVFLLSVNRYVRYATNILLTFVYLTGVFSVFPTTRWIIVGTLGGVFQAFANGWQGFINYLPDLLNVVVIFVVAHYGLKFVSFFFDEIEKGDFVLSGFHPEWAALTFQLVRFLIGALAFVMAFPHLPGSSSPAFQGVSVFIGILFSLGSTSVISNIVAGVVLTYTRAFRIGDRVKIADTVGDVVEKGLFVTRVRTLNNVETSIPNSLILGCHINNYRG